MGKEFRLIEENTKTIFAGREEEADQVLRQLKQQGYTKSGMRRAGQFCIQVYERELKRLEGLGMVRPVSQEIQDFYELVDHDRYSEEMGLCLEADSGAAVFL